MRYLHVGFFSALAACTQTGLPHRKLVVVIGQSNAGDSALASDLTDPTYAAPYPSVSYAATLGDDVNNAETDVVTYPWAPLGTRPYLLGTDSMGIELSMGRALDEADPGQWFTRHAMIAGRW